VKTPILQTPVAFLIFNRPDVTNRVFAEIAKARPRQLLIVADGARAQRTGEAEKVRLTRAVTERIDWECEILTNFSDENLGCKKRVSSGIDWVFTKVERAIFLEDDCFPHPSFFPFCEQLLEHYKDDQRVSHVNGSNFVRPVTNGNTSYRFSHFNFVWGWATWRDRWQADYDVEMKMWPDFRDRSNACWHCSPLTKSVLTAVFDSVHSGRVDTWDYQWSFAARLNNRLSIVPNQNLISNIGFGEDATHTKNVVSMLSNLPTQEMVFPLVRPAGVFADSVADGAYARRFVDTPWPRHYLFKILRNIRGLGK
jgi:hypothetical protein